MRILILGGDGMLGHQLARSWTAHSIFGTFRSGAEHYPRELRDRFSSAAFGIEATDTAALTRVMGNWRPDVVVNAIGVVKQRAEAKDAIASIEVNALFPHRLAGVCAELKARLIQISTDCVFSGEKGMYGEDDIADARDLYGLSKFLGEVVAPGAITLRTSIIGLELSRKKSLVEWFLAQTGTIKGYTGAIYTGFTTMEMARIIEHVIVNHPGKSGVYNVSSDPIDKYTLLMKLRDRLGRDIRIERDEDFRCDRSLDSTRFRAEFGYQPPSWDEMLDELAEQILRREVQACA
jgi:dTDP-4-dehydrorhamnose reductase